MFTCANNLKDIGAIYCDNTTLFVLNQMLQQGLKNEVGITIYVEDAEKELPALKSGWKYRQQNVKTVSIYVPEPLQMYNGVADRLYWDDAMGRYCIEKNIGEDLYGDIMVNDKPKLIRTNVRHKLGFMPFNPELSIITNEINCEPASQIVAEIPFMEEMSSDKTIDMLAINYQPNGQPFSFVAPINLKRGDFIEAKIDLTEYMPGTTEEINALLNIGDGISLWEEGCYYYIGIYPNSEMLNIGVNVNGENYDKDIAYDTNTPLLIRVDKAGIYINGNKINLGTDLVSLVLDHLLQLSTIDIGECEVTPDRRGNQIYDWIRIVRNIPDGDIDYKYHYQTYNDSSIIIDNEDLDLGHMVNITEIYGNEENIEYVGELQEDGTYIIKINTSSGPVIFGK